MTSRAPTATSHRHRVGGLRRIPREVVERVVRGEASL